MTKTCDECALWNTEKCTWIESKRSGTLKKTDAACGEFLQGSKKQGKKQLKDSGLSPDGSFEAIYHDGKPSFLVLRDKDFRILESIEINGETFHPKETKHTPYEAYGFFQGPVPNREDLFWTVRQEVQRFVDVEPIWQDVLSAAVLLSYQQEKLLTVPYLFLYGDNESGKSTVLQILKFLCYRPMYGVTVPSADIYGYLEDVDSVGCILEDEVQGIHQDTDKIKIYKAGYKQGAVVPRTIITQNDRIIKYYHTFCFKACASEQIPQVKGFRERFVEIPMVEGYPEKEWADVTKEDLKRLYDLRNTLLKWRMLSRNWELPNPEVDMKGRLKELWKPLLQITHGLTVYDTLSKFVETQRKERLSSRQNTLEGHIVKVVVDLLNQSKEESSQLPFKTIWDELSLDLDGKLDDKKPHVMDTSEFFQVTKNKVGYRLREILSGRTGVKREKIGKEWVSSKVYVFDLGKVQRVARKYGFELVTKLPSLPSSEGVQAPFTMNKTMEKSPSAPPELSKLSNSVTSKKELPESPLPLQTPSLTSLPSLLSLSMEKTEEPRGAASEVSEVSLETPPITCGHCRKWHTGRCSFPGDPNCIVPTNTFATQCGEFDLHGCGFQVQAFQVVKDGCDSQ